MSSRESDSPHGADSVGCEDDCPELLQRWLTEAVQQGASDLHLVPGHRPVLRRHGQLQELDEPVLTDADLRPLLAAAAPERLFSRFEQNQNLDFSLQMPVESELHRFRVNFFIASNEIGACIRLIPARIPDFDWAGFPRDLADRLAHFRNGLVLITGVTGSGKTTSLAMIVNLLNAEGHYRIITVEEPVEYRYPTEYGSVVTQREVGLDCQSFADGLKYGLRQDPDVILVGEIRDRDTAQMALTAAETGHLVLSTLHTSGARGAISRFADLFPQDVQFEIRSQLSISLKAVISQHLLPSSVAGEKRELALEILFNNAPIASAIRTGKLQSIENYILTGRDQGMISLEESVRCLLASGRIAPDTADRFLPNS